MVTSVAILCKMAACKQCTHEFALPNCSFCPNGGHKATSKIVQAIVVYDKCLVWCKWLDALLFLVTEIKTPHGIL
jgi:hypothetical protein